MSALMTVAVALTLKDLFSGPMRGAGASLDQFGAKARQLGDRLQSAGKWATATGTMITAAMRAPIRAFAEAEEAANRLKIAMLRSDGTASGFERMSAFASELGKTMPGTTADFQNMLTMLQRQGIAMDNILGGTGKAAANLGVLLKMAPEGAAEFVAKLQDATGTAAKDMVSLADTIQRTFYMGVDPSNMLQAYAALTPAMSAIKAKGLEGAQAMAPLIAMLDQAGLVGGSAGGALAKVFTLPFTSTKALADVNKELKTLGISALKFTKGGEWAGLNNMFAQFAKLAGLDTQRRVGFLADIWGVDRETAQALDTLITKNQQGYEDARRTMEAQADTNQRIEQARQTLNYVWDTATGTITTTLSDWINTIGPDLKRAAAWIGQLGEAAGTWIKENPQMAQWSARIATVLGPLLIGLGALGFAIGGIVKGIGLLLPGKKAGQLAEAAGDLLGKAGKGVVPVYVTNWGGQGGADVDLPDGDKGKKGPGRAATAAGLAARVVVPLAVAAAPTALSIDDRDLAVLEEQLSGKSFAESVASVWSGIKKSIGIGIAPEIRIAEELTRRMASLNYGEVFKPAPTVREQVTQPTLAGPYSQGPARQTLADRITAPTLGADVQTLTQAAEAQRAAGDRQQEAGTLQQSAAQEFQTGASTITGAASTLQGAATSMASTAASLQAIGGTITIRVEGPGKVTEVAKAPGSPVDLAAGYTGKQMSTP